MSARSVIRCTLELGEKGLLRFRLFPPSSCSRNRDWQSPCQGIGSSGTRSNEFSRGWERSRSTDSGKGKNLGEHSVKNRDMDPLDGKTAGTRVGCRGV